MLNSNNKKKYILFAFLIIVISVAISIPALSLYMKLTHTYDYRKNNNTVIAIDMSDSANPKSYSKDFRLVSVMINGSRINLDDYDNSDWQWRQEWGYIIHQSGDNHFEMNIPVDAKSIKISYVKEGASGIATFSVNDKKIATVDTYHNGWETVKLSVKYVTASQKIMLTCYLALSIAIILTLIIHMVMCLIHKNEKLAPVKKSLTMFDLAKGVGMICIIAGHTFEAVSNENSFESVFSENIVILLLGMIMIYGMMPMFFMASGFGFRPADNKLTIRKQIRFWLKPYILVAIGTVLFSLARYFIDGSYTMSQLKSALLPFIFLVPHDGQCFGMTVNSIGPMWFGTALCFAWIILNAVLNITGGSNDRKDINNKDINKKGINKKGINKKGINNKIARCMRIAFFVIVLGLGYYFSIHDIDAYCIPQIMYAIVLLYAGYIINRKKLLENATGMTRFIICLMCFTIFGISAVNGINFSIALAHWGNNYILAVIASILSGIVILWIMLRLNPYFKGKLKHIKKIGRGSYYIFYIHTFEWLAIPWKELYLKSGLNIYVAFVLMLVLRSVIIFGIYKLIFVIKKRIK